MRPTPAVILTVVLLVLLIGAAPLPACPGCSQAVAENGAKGLAAGFNYSIIGLMSMPFLVAGSIGGAIWRAYRRARR